MMPCTPSTSTSHDEATVTQPYPSEAQVLSWTETLSNWGRWGPGDRLGTLNFITTESRLRGIRAVSQGLTVSCAHEITATPRQDGNPSRLMIATGEGVT